jgi:hypothetical protein
MPGDCAGPLKKEKLMVICAPSARGRGNCVPLICRLFRPSSELVFGRSRKFSQKLTALNWYGPAQCGSITNGVQSPGAGSSFTKPSGDLCVGTLRKLFVILCTARHSHLVLRMEGKGHERNNPR